MGAILLNSGMLGSSVVLNVRLATNEDRDEVLTLVRGLLFELGGNPASAQALYGVFRSLVSGGGGFIVLAEVDGVPRAVCTASYTTALRTAGRYCILQEMFVESESRGSGVGQAVIEFALEHAADNGCEVVELGTPRRGSRQIEFYERSGFENVGARMRWRTSENRYR